MTRDVDPASLSIKPEVEAWSVNENLAHLRACADVWTHSIYAMLAEKEPLAMKLLAEYHNLPMPNLGLNNDEIQNVLGYIDEESHRKGYHQSR